MSRSIYNSEALGIVAIGSVVQKAKQVSYAKSMLILPLVSHRETLDFLSKASTKVRSLEELLSKSGDLFANYADRFESLLPISINSLQILTEIGVLKPSKDGIVYQDGSSFDFNSESLGKRAIKIAKSNEKITTILKGDASNLYLQLRIRL